MKIAYYMPFKPMGHKNPSGDLIIGTEIFSHLETSGNLMSIASRLRCRWIYYRPFKLVKLLKERIKTVGKLRKIRPDLWLTYHTYYKAPDLLGPYCARKLGIPYIIFQGIYSTKRRKEAKTLPGFLLNRGTLLSAQHIFTNKRKDHSNLQRIIPENKLTYIAPGIEPESFSFSEQQREAQRSSWNIVDETVILTAAMMRKGVKSDGLSIVIKVCSKLVKDGHNLKLIVAGDGECRNQLERQARELLGDRFLFIGRTPRAEMHKIYSGGDIFAFPGIHESLGMVYLEAQSCGLPAVAYEDWGAREAIIHGETGLLSKSSEPTTFTRNIGRLITDQSLRKRLGSAAAQHIRSNHDLKKNYDLLQQKLQKVVKTHKL